MLEKLALLILFIQIIRCAHICQEDGLFRNKDDRTSYYECTDGKNYIRRCPLAEDGISYKVFDGQTCIELDLAFVCPQENGKYQNINNEHQYYECVNSESFLKNCPQNTKFDGLDCGLDLPQSDAEIESKLIVDNFMCPEPNGLFSNPEDKHSYYECIDSEFTIRYCPRERKRHQRRAHHKNNFRKRGVFDGKKCIHPQHNDKPKDSRKTRQAPHNNRFKCPKPDGYFADSRNPMSYFSCTAGVLREERCGPSGQFDKTYSTCVYPGRILEPVKIGGGELLAIIQQNGPVIARNTLEGNIKCPTGSTYDKTTGRCRIELLIEPYREARAPAEAQVVPKCPEGSTYNITLNKCRVESFFEPVEGQGLNRGTLKCPNDFKYDRQTGQCVKLTYVDPTINRRPNYNPTQPERCPSGLIYDPNTRSCVKIRFRRNGRVEIEDGINGEVIVDTWNEGQWKWDRNRNGNRILTDINGWQNERHERHGSGAVLNNK